MVVVAERNRIARDMHDGLVQYVYALGLQLEHARDLAASEPDGVTPVLTGAIQQTNHVLSEMRTFIYQLRPIIMQEKQIGEWVVDLCQQFQLATGIPVRAEVGATAGQELSPEVSIALFRIIQEALANIYKHAQASQATLSLDFTPDGARLVIEDDGRGFDVDARLTPDIEHGHGLKNIDERVRELGASLQLESALGAGTRLMAGASGYLLKEINKTALINAVMAVSEGRSLLDPEVTRKVLERIRKMAASTDEVARAALSDQEKRVLRLAAQGKTNKQIAADL